MSESSRLGRRRKKREGGNIRKGKTKRQTRRKKNRLNVRLLIYLFLFLFPRVQPTANVCIRTQHKRLRKFIGSFLPQAHSPEKQKMMNV